jgi:HEAT repeat protein
MRKWLVVARGMAGDAQVAAELEKIVREDPDMSTRVEATRAYARAAKETAIPLLVELLGDPTAIRDRVIIAGKGEGIGMLDGFRPVAGVAADELSRLGHHDLVLSHRQSAGSQGTQTAPGG